ncbi:MAG: type 2 lanthipeptide synthetase LanM [Cyanobacteriota bacterium]
MTLLLRVGWNASHPFPSMPAPAASLSQTILGEGWSLHQRLAITALRGAEAPPLAANADPLASWRKVVAPDQLDAFVKRLQWDGLTPDAAAWALEPVGLEPPEAPAWLPLLEALCQVARDAASVGSLASPFGLEHRGDQLPFVHVWRPAAAWALTELQRRCHDLQPSLSLQPAAWLDLATALLERLCSTADQALWALFNQRRTPGQMLLAHLGASGDGQGPPVREAYDAFVAELLGSGYGLLLAEFPVLGRLLGQVTGLWLEGSEEMLRRLAASRSDLQQSFGIEPEVALATIQLGLSDPHRGGRAVAILTFGLGESSRKVVYKPKDMQVDLAYQQFLQQINRASSLPPLRWLTVVSCEGYGFMECVEHRLCSSDEELGCFYTNAGRLMAVLHLLGCTDCHHENLIASADQLVLIDTETLLEADWRDLISDNGNDATALSALETSMQSSVLRSGLLPQWLIAGAGRKLAYDVSALGIQPPPPERDQPGWLGLNSDGMLAGRSKQPSELPTSLPVGLGQPQRLSDFVDQLCAGFAEQLQEAIRLRTFLLAGLEGFCGKPRRLVARATRVYFTIQRQMLDPAALRSGAAHGLKLEQLCRSFLLANETPLHWPMFQAELRQMEQLDIPFFEHPIDGEDLPLSHGLGPIPGYFKSSGLAAATQRIANLDTPDIVFQLQLIRGAIAARHVRSASVAEVPLAEPGPIGGGAGPTQKSADVYLQQAYQLGEELWSAAIRDPKGRPEWLGMDLGADGESFHFGLIGPSLYSGSSGIALTFARLALDRLQNGYTVGSERWLQRAWACFASIVELTERQDQTQLFRYVRDLPYGLSGSGGTLLALLLLQRAGMAEAQELAHRWIAQLRPERLLADQVLDVIGGVAGLIGPLLLAETARTQELALLCGDRLLALQLEGGGWPNGPALSVKPALTGFSHGAAGMAAALGRLAQATAESRFADGALRAIAYERSVFDAARRNWPDFRSSSDVFMNSWCHGAPGILLGRHLLQATGLADPAMAEEIAAARSSTIGAVVAASRKADFPAHLCCGVLGLTSLLRFDAQASGLPLAAEVAQAESVLICQANEAGGYVFFSVDTGSLNLPGLYSGKAGVALALLEAATGEQWIPQVLSAGLLPWPS